jgi:anti-anti-sigma factor
MEISEESTGTCVIVGISGRLDTTNYTILEKRLSEMTDNGQDKILVDCTKMDYISSSGLRILLMILKKVNVMKGRFVLCGLQENIREIFEISGFTSIFEIHTNRDEALKTF